MERRFSAVAWALEATAALAVGGADVAAAQASPSAQRADSALVYAAATDSASKAAAARAAAAAAPPPVTFFNDVTANAFVSFAYTYNTNRPTDRLNSFRVFDQNENTFDVDVAELVLQKPVAKAGDAGFRIDLTVGGAIPQKTQSFGLSVGQSADLQQALLSYIAPVGGGLRLDFGKFVTHMGYELIEGYDGFNDNYSRSFLFNYAIPLTHTGVKASYALSSKVSATLMAVNGWDNVRDNNSGKSVGAQLALTPVAPLAVYLNYLGGPEKTDTSGFARSVFDVVATYKLTSALTLGLNGDYGSESHASVLVSGKTAVWKGVAGYAHYDVTARLGLALRTESFRDEGGTRLGTGVPTTVSGTTLTPSYRFTDRFLVRGDVRFDSANQDIYVRRSGELRSHQTTVAANVIFVY